MLSYTLGRRRFSFRFTVSWCITNWLLLPVPSFFYLANTPVPKSTIDSLISYIPRLFALPQEEKDRIAMRNNQSFLGYTRFGAEFTKGVTDLREQFDFASPYVSKWAPGKPDYLRLWGPSQAWWILFVHAETFRSNITLFSVAWWRTTSRFPWDGWDVYNWGWTAKLHLCFIGRRGSRSTIWCTW